jgi:hypothetical protein
VFRCDVEMLVQGELESELGTTGSIGRARVLSELRGGRAVPGRLLPALIPPCVPRGIAARARNTGTRDTSFFYSQSAFLLQNGSLKDKPCDTAGRKPSSH